MKKSLWQKGFAGFLCVCILLLMVPPMTLVMAEGESITLDAAGTKLTISGYTASADIIAAISAGGAYESLDRSGVKEVVINTVTELTAFATGGNSTWNTYFPALEVLDATGSAVTSLAHRQFKACTTVKKIYLPAAVSSIGNNVFESCSALTTLSSDNTADNIIDLASFNVGTSTFYSAFARCSSIQYVRLNPAMKVLGGSAFQHCTSLKEIVLHEGITTLDSRALGALNGNTNMPFTVVIPDSLTTINNAFGRASNYTIKYSGNVDAVQELLLSATGFISTSDGTNPIYDFSGSDVTAAQINELAGYEACVQKIILTDCNQFLNYTPEEGSVLATLNAAGKVEWPKVKTSITVENGTATFKNYQTAQEIVDAISAHDLLKDLTGRETVTKIQFECPQLTNLNLFAHSANKSGWAVQDTAWGVLFPNLIEADFTGTAMASIPERYFGSSTSGQNNTVIQKITFPNTVKTIGMRAFQSCSALQEVYFEAGNAAVTASTYVFMGCKALTTVVLPQNMETIPGQTFQAADALTSLTLPLNLKTIASGSFIYQNTQGGRRTERLVLNLPNTVTTIEQDAFKGTEYITYKYSNTDAATANAFFDMLFSSTGPLNPTVATGNLILDFSGSAITPEKLEALSNVSNYNTKILKVIVTDNDAFLDINPTEAGVVKTLFDAGKLEYDITPADIAVENGVATITRFETAQDLANAILGLNGVTADVDVDTPEERALITKVVVNCPELKDLSLFAMSKSASNVWSVQETAWGVMFPNMEELDLSGTSMNELSNRYFGSSDGAHVNHVIKKVILPATITYLGQRAFQGCSALEEVIVLPGTVMATMSTYTFCNATALKTVTLPANMTALPASTFQGCINLNDITWPTNLTSIGSLAFGIVSGGTRRIELPSTVMSIDAKAFDRNYGLTIVVNSDVNATFTDTPVIANNTVLELAGVFDGLSEKGIYTRQNGAWVKPEFVMNGAKSATKAGSNGVMFGATLANSAIMDRIVEAGALAIPYKQIGNDYTALTKELENIKLLSAKFDAGALSAACEEAVSGKKDIAMNYVIWNLPTTSNAKIAATMYVVYEVADTQVVLYAESVEDTAGDGTGVATPYYVFN